MTAQTRKITWILVWFFLVTELPFRHLPTGNGNALEIYNHVLLFSSGQMSTNPDQCVCKRMIIFSDGYRK